MTKKNQHNLENNKQHNKKEEIKKKLEECKKIKEENEKLAKKVKELEEIVKNTQLQYLHLKNDFDSYVKRIESQKSKLKEETLIKIVKEFLPTIEMFEKVYQHLPEEFQNHKWTEGLSIVNKKINSFMNNIGLEKIPSVGKNVDEQLHEVIHVKEINDNDKKGKIIEEVKPGYFIKIGNQKKVLQAAKVILGN